MKDIVGKKEPKDLYALSGLLFDNLLDGIAHCRMIVDAEGRPTDFSYLWVNKSFGSMTGLIGIEGKKSTDVIPDIAVVNQKLFEIYDRTSLTGQPERFEVYLESLSKWFSVSFYCLEKKMFCMVFSDITGRKQIEKNLEEARIAARNVLEDLQEEKTHAENEVMDKKKFFEAVQAVNSHIIITDSDGVILYANAAAEQITGYSKQEMLGKRSSLWGKRMDRTFYEDMWKTIKIEKRFFHAEIKNMRKNGSEYYADLSIVPILDSSGNSKFFVGIERDISEEKQLEKLRTDFLSLASHQLRTPLSGTKWLIDTMRREILGTMTAKQREYLDYLYEINERMIKLVTDMLTVLMLENGVSEIKAQNVLISKLFEEIFLMTESASRSQRVVLRNAFTGGDALHIHSDPQLLRTMLESLVSNAIDYSHEGQEVVIDAKEDGPDVIFSVKDVGIGIPRDEQQRIFERFYRASNAKEFKPDGTGLGLYIASLLARKIGAQITFETELNKGSIFYLRVPK